MARVEIRILVLGALTGAVGCAAIALGASLREIVPVTSAAALLLLASRVILDRTARWAVGPRGEVLASLVLLGAVPILVLGALFALADPIVQTRWRCGTGDIALFVLAPPLVFIGMMLTTLVTALFAGRERRFGDAVLRVLALAACAGAIVLFAGSARRASQYPPPDRWLDAQPIVGQVQAADDDGQEMLWGVVAKRYRTAMGPLSLVRDCDTYGDLGSTVEECRVTLVPAGDEALLAPVDGLRVKPSDLLTVRRDVVDGVWLIEGGKQAAYRIPELRPDDLTVADVARTVSPPGGWITGLGVGIVIAGVALWRRRGAAQRLAAIMAGQEGTLENGWIEIEDGAEPVRAPAGVPAGPVVVLARGAERSPTYRTGASGEDATVLAGTRASLAEELRAVLARQDALALAAVALTAAPLLGAWVRGIVF